MKKIVLFAALGLVFTGNHLQAQDNEKDKTRIEGSGNVITKNIAVQSFSELEASGVFELKLSQGAGEQLKIEAEDNLQDLFEVKNTGSLLTIKMKDHMHFNSRKKIIVYLTFNKLKSLDLAMVGNVLSTDKLNFEDLKINSKSVGNLQLELNARKLDIENKSVGNFALSGKADNAVIQHKGVGSFKAANLLVQTMDIEASGIGSVEVNAEKELKVKDSFLGKVTNKGGAPTRRMKKVVI
jgi:hypothetical protein